MRRVVHLSSVHNPFDIRIFHKQCQTLAQADYDVSLIATHTQDETVEGVRISKIPTPRNRFERMFFTVWRIYRRAIALNGDVYHFHDPELIPVGIVLHLNGKRVIYDVHEDLPKSILDKSWLFAPLRWPISRVMAFVEWLGVLFCDAVVTATPAISRRFPESKTVVVQNFPMAAEFGSVGKDREQAKRPAWFCYVGGITVSRGGVEMIRAIGLVDPASHAKLKIAGPVRPEGLFELVGKDPGLENAEFLGWQSRTEVADLFSCCRAGLVLFHPAKNHVEAQPNKLFEYMSAGLPVVASDFPLWREIVEGVDCGLLVDPTNPKAISKAMTWILEHPEASGDMGMRGRKAVETTYNWEQEAMKLLDLYERVCT